MNIKSISYRHKHVLKQITASNVIFNKLALRRHGDMPLLFGLSLNYHMSFALPGLMNAMPIFKLNFFVVLVLIVFYSFVHISPIDDAGINVR